MGCVCHISWLLDLRFPFWPPKSQKLSFWKFYELKKLFSCISRLPGVRFPFCFFPQLSFDMWKVCVIFNGYRIYGLRFDPPNPKNLVFESLWFEKNYFHAYIDNREFDSHSVSWYNFILMCGRYASCFLAIGYTVCFLTLQTPKT